MGVEGKDVVPVEYCGSVTCNTLSDANTLSVMTKNNYIMQAAPSVRCLPPRTINRFSAMGVWQVIHNVSSRLNQSKYSINLLTFM